MHTIRVLLDAEALLLGSTGVLAVALPEAFPRLLGQAGAASELIFVPAGGAMLVGMAALQHGLVGQEDRGALRLLLQCRMITDMLLVVICWARLATFAAATQTVLLGGLSVALVFAAVRFYALVRISESAAEPGLSGA